MFARFVASQLSNPAGPIGRLLLGRLWNVRNRALNDATFEALALQPDDHVLEVGFGGGYLLGRLATVLPAGALAGVDRSPTMVRYAARRHRRLIGTGKLDLRCAPADALPYPAAAFTKACTVNSIFYWPDAAAAFLELRRVLQPAGLLVVCFTCRESLERKDFAAHGLRLYDVEDVESLLSAADFGAIGATRAADAHRRFWCVRASA